MEYVSFKDVPWLIEEKTVDPFKKTGLKWGIKRRQLYMDSLYKGCLFNPFIFVRETKDGREVGKYQLIDGRERVATIIRYLDDEFPLSGNGDEHIRIPEDFKDKRYSELPLDKKHLISHRNIYFYVVKGEIEELQEINYRINR